MTDDKGGFEVSDPKGNWRPDPDVITATRAWDLLSAGSSRDEVEEALLQEFDVPPDQLRDEMDTLIAELVEKKLLLAGN